MCADVLFLASWHPTQRGRAMTIAETPRAAGTYPTPVRPDDARFVELAARIVAVATDHAAEHDRDATFVAESYAAMREQGSRARAAPEGRGGRGASMRRVCYARAGLPRHDGATGLSVA